MCGNEINVGREGFLFPKVMLNKRCKNVTEFNQVKGEIALKMFLDRKQNFPKRYWIRRMEENWMLSIESNSDVKFIVHHFISLLRFWSFEASKVYCHVVSSWQEHRTLNLKQDQKVERNKNLLSQVRILERIDMVCRLSHSSSSYAMIFLNISILMTLRYPQDILIYYTVAGWKEYLGDGWQSSDLSWQVFDLSTKIFPIPKTMTTPKRWLYI